MSDLDTYLQTHYLNAEQFAAHCGINVEELDELIYLGLVPEPSYVVTSASTLKSHAFGEMDAPLSIAGSYFHPKNCTWVARALGNRSPAALRERFSKNFGSSLAVLNRSVWRLPDSFTESGQAIPPGLAARTEAAWGHFLRGTFGLCVADPSTEASIARKEVLQEKLTALTSNGADASCTRIERSELVELIDHYASASMPFSPVEYPRSSRKRLVEDLQERLAEAGQVIKPDFASVLR